ncbi:MAG: TIGR02281 family clan AA aspartic protease [Burkholderiales bacterium]
MPSTDSIRGAWPSRALRGLAAAAAAGVMASTARAADVAVVGLFPGKAVVVIDRAPPRTISVGQRTTEGVTLVATQGDTATFDIDGAKRTLKMGQYYQASAAGGSQRVVLKASEGGHFIASGRINGGSIRMLVDTGATIIAIPATDAKRLAIEYLDAPRARIQTANGSTTGFRVTLDSVVIGDITVNNVEAMVLETGLSQALLGMSFLNRTSMQREGDTLTLVKRF